ncbi:MAG TPA: DUF2764 family protein [Sphaerochaeta sp.]|nr:DUF2764 family protein [Spirochaetales bacterium]HPX28942.1 DUF2764 family protein [Sphaerochaeta sp.]HQB53998.1 DUF2764 family protein [Sphaerochaeta sp.]
MASYYYFAATLPLLRLQRKMPMSVDVFKAQAEKHLNSRDWQTLKSGLNGTPSKHAMLKAYQNYAFSLNTALAQKRQVRLGFTLDETLQRQTIPGEIAVAADELLELSDPLEAEMKFISLLWQRIDRLVGMKVFEFDALLGYGLKLLLLERVNVFTREVGQATFENLLGTLRSEIDRM